METSTVPMDMAIAHETLAISEKNGEIINDLFEIQIELKPIEKTETNTFHKSKYANYASVWQAVGPMLIDRNILTIHTPGLNELTGTVYMDTLFLKMTSGQWIRIRGSSAPKDLAPQAIGSTHTYLRRYNVGAVLNLIFVDEDDDGNAASGYSKTSNTKGAAKPTKNVNTPNSDYGDYNQYLNEKDRDFTPKKTANVTRGVGNLKKLEPIMNPAEADETADSLISQINEVKNEGLLKKWQSDKKNVVESLPQKLKEKVMGEYGQRLNEFRSESA